jgi:catechol 2,3-dioxygenase-like lactoylglutathione lyase family enzyme
MPCLGMQTPLSKALMRQTIGHIALVVRDYDEAIEFFTRTLNFKLIEDTRLSDTKRWVLVAPPGSQGSSLLLAQAASPEQASRIGNQTGGRVFLFLHTDDFWRDYNEMTARRVKFIRPPNEEVYGIVAVFEDLYGNQWDLLELKK